MLFEQPFRKPFENSLSRSVHPCTLLDASFCGAKTSPLCETTDIPVRSETTRRLANSNRRRIFDTLRIFSSGRDAAGYIRSDVSASLKLAVNSPKDGRGISQKQVLFQNLSSTDVYGRTSVERYKDVHFWQGNAVDMPYISKGRYCIYVCNRRRQRIGGMVGFRYRFKAE